MDNRAGVTVLPAAGVAAAESGRTRLPQELLHTATASAYAATASQPVPSAKYRMTAHQLHCTAPAANAGLPPHRAM